MRYWVILCGWPANTNKNHASCVPLMLPCPLLYYPAKVMNFESDV